MNASISYGCRNLPQAIEMTSELGAVAVESPFSSFREIANDRMAQHTRFGTRYWRSAGRPVIRTRPRCARLGYHVDLMQADPEEAMEHSKVAALLIAGTGDHNIPMRHSAELMGTSGSHASLWIVKGEDHSGTLSVAGPEIRASNPRLVPADNGAN